MRGALKETPDPPRKMRGALKEGPDPPPSFVGTKRKRGRPVNPPLVELASSSALQIEKPTEESLQKLQKERTRVLQKAKALGFPDHLRDSYKTSSSRQQYGSDYPKGGSAGLVAYHKRKLKCILDDLLLSHRWHEAAGVLSVLLKGSSLEDRWHSQNFHLYWAALEVTRQVEGLQGNDMRFRRMYQILYDKQPQNVRTRDKTQAGAVLLEQALYLMSQQCYDDAQLASRTLMDVPPYRDHAAGNMIHGLALYHLWYQLVMQELGQSLQKGLAEQSESTEMSLAEVVGENEELSRNHEKLKAWHGECSRGRFEDDSLSECSAQRDQDPDPEVKKLKSRMNFHQRRILSDTFNGPSQGFYDDMDEEGEKGYLQTAVIRCTPVMDRKLFPVHLPRMYEGEVYAVPMVTAKVKGPYTNAVKHLRQVLLQAPDLTMVLLPLVQLLLAVADIEGAYKEIEMSCQSSHHVLPFRIKSMLLESLEPKNPEMLSHSYEEILEKDPSSTQSIEALIIMHRNGDYDTKLLLEYIACHLDASSGSTYIWHTMASCFLQLKESQEEFSKANDPDYVENAPDYVENARDHIERFTNGIMEFFLQDLVRRTWIDRGTWWLCKHFKSQNINQELKQNGGSRVAYKAACAAHIFGPCANFVSDVQQTFTERGDDQLLAIVDVHSQHSFDLLGFLEFSSVDKL